MTESYCSHCKAKTPNHESRYEMSASGRKMLKSKCSCGAKKSAFAPGDAKAGDGLFSFIPGVGSILNDLGNTAIGVGKSVAVPIMTKALMGKLGGSVRSRKTVR